MNRTVILVMLMLFAGPASAQENTLISGDVEHGGFGGPVLKIGQISGESGIFMGGRGGWIINHKLILGGGGYGLVNYISVPSGNGDGEYKITMGYGGGEMEYVVAPNRVFHVSVQLLIAAGAVNLTEKNEGDHSRDMFDRNSWDEDRIFVVEPGINLMVNVTSFMRIGFGGSNRWVTGVDFSELTNEDLSGVSAVLSLKFGDF